LLFDFILSWLEINNELASEYLYQLLRHVFVGCKVKF
jgi:hypothetical protein